MSDLEKWTGTLSEVTGHGSAEKTAEYLLRQSDEDSYEDCYLSWSEMLDDVCHDTFITVGDKVYRIDKHRGDPYEGVYHATQNQDGTIDFIVSYHNGGIGLSESLEYAVSLMEKGVS